MILVPYVRENNDKHEAYFDRASFLEVNIVVKAVILDVINEIVIIFMLITRSTT
ncbi:hypothetical protein Hanom_Chr09g00870291 [Helianthus anomalus]